MSLASFRSSGSTEIAVRNLDGGDGGANDEFRLIKWHFLAHVGSAGPNGRSPRIILVTSARPGEGKSYVSHRLAANLALDPNIHVTLVDANFEHPALGTSSWMGGSSGGPGLLDHLQDPSSGQGRLVMSTGLPNVKVILAGSARQNAPELVANGRLEELLAPLVDEPNSFVVIDAGSVLGDASAAILARAAGQVAFVVASNSTSRNDVTHGIAVLDRIAGPVDETTLGLVFN